MQRLNTRYCTNCDELFEGKDCPSCGSTNSVPVGLFFPGVNEGAKLQTHNVREVTFLDLFEESGG